MTKMVWQIENPRFRLRIAAKGGEVCSLWDKQLQREWFWQPQENVWNHSATQLFPVVGRLIHEGLWLSGFFFPLPAHGFLRQQIFHCSGELTSGLVLKACANAATLAVWPWKWLVTVHCELTDDGLIFSQTVTNEDEAPFRFSAGWHPGFALPLSEEAGWEVLFSERGGLGPMPTRDRTLITPERPARITRYPLTNSSFSCGAVYFGDCQEQRIQLCSPDGKIVLEMETGHQKWLALWGVPGADLLCIEPLAGTTDAPDFDGQASHKRGLLQLAPGQSQTFAVRLRFGVDA
jgi:Galactose mutarotase and related enzymes